MGNTKKIQLSNFVCRKKVDETKNGIYFVQFMGRCVSMKQELQTKFRPVFARLPAYNPFVGFYHHAPSAGNRGAVYFSNEIVDMDEITQRKKFRHNPLTGTFHVLPGYYDPLHGLEQFRTEKDAMDSLYPVDIVSPKHEKQPAGLFRMVSDSKLPFVKSGGEKSGKLSRSFSAPNELHLLDAPPCQLSSIRILDRRQTLPIGNEKRMSWTSETTDDSENSDIGGYVSTGKGVFINSLVKSNGDTRMNKSFEVELQNVIEKKQKMMMEEYSQSAPTMPANPFIARRLLDNDHLRVMAINREAPRKLDQMYRNVEKIQVDETMLPKPYFIHEHAVTEKYVMDGEDQLGDGSYAVVKPGTSRSDGRKVAIKQVHKRYLRTEEAKKAVDREVEIHLRLQHKHVVRLYEVYETEDFLYLVMEKANRGTLRALLNTHRYFPEAKAGRLAQQILRAVFYLQQHGVLHSDIKPENLLLTEKEDSGSSNINHLNIELCDFGLAVKVPDVRFFKYTGDVHKVPYMGLTGSAGYIAPEIMGKCSYGKPADLWSTGIVIYEMLAGYQPFYPPSACMDEDADFTGGGWNKISEVAQNLVKGLLHRDPAKRLTVQQALAHPWFENASFVL